MLTKLIEQTTQFKELKKAYEGCYEHFLNKCDQVVTLDNQIKELYIDYSAICEHNATLDELASTISKEHTKLKQDYRDMEEGYTNVLRHLNQLRVDYGKLRSILHKASDKNFDLESKLRKLENTATELASLRQDIAIYKTRLKTVVTIRDILATLVTCGMLITVSLLLGASNA